MKNSILCLLLIAFLPAMSQNETNQKEAGLSVRLPRNFASPFYEGPKLQYAAYYQVRNSQGHLIGGQLGLPAWESTYYDYGKVTQLGSWVETYYLFDLLKEKFHIGPALTSEFTHLRYNSFVSTIFPYRTTSLLTSLCIRPTKNFTINKVVVGISLPIRLITLEHFAMRTDNPAIPIDVRRSGDWDLYMNRIPSLTPVLSLGVKF